MKKLNSNGFALLEVIVITIVLAAFVGIGLLTYSRISAASGSVEQKAKDAIVIENLKIAQQSLAEFVTANKTIPSKLDVAEDVNYRRIDNQQAELCGTLLTANPGGDTTLSFWDKLSGKASNIEGTHIGYRDDVDFSRHAKGRNCYQINYAPINEAYDKKYESEKKNHKVCDSLRQYHGKFTGQTIKGFFIGGSFTTNPGTAGGRAVLAQDVDAYDSSCKKIPVSDLKVGDKVEMYIEDGPINGSERTYFVKAIKKDS